MIGEIDFFGVFVPALLVLMLVAFFISVALRRLLTLIDARRFIWHRSLFDLGLYVIVLGFVVLVSHRMHP